MFVFHIPKSVRVMQSLLAGDVGNDTVRRVSESRMGIMAWEKNPEATMEHFFVVGGGGDTGV